MSGWTLASMEQEFFCANHYHVQRFFDKLV